MLPIIPVIDLRAGQAVQAIAGRRSEYRPVRSILSAKAQPRALACAFAERLGLRELYLADLDAILGGEPDWGTYDQLLAAGSKLWIDAGIGELGQAECLAAFHPQITGIIAGLETLPDRAILAALVEAVGPERLVFSLDLRAGKPLTRSPKWQNIPPFEIAQAAIELGVRRMIVLDLARVGVNTGTGTADLCRVLRTLSPAVELIAGGGVRGRQDLQRLAAAGCQGALVASALHDGRLTRDDCCGR